MTNQFFRFFVKNYNLSYYYKMDYKLVIVSHRRPEILKNNTLALLQRTGAKNPIIWVNDAKDYDDYIKLFPTEEIRIGGETLVQKRNLIQNSFPLDTNIVMIDDDIKEIVILKEKGKKVILQDFNKLVELGFSYTKKESS